MTKKDYCKIANVVSHWRTVDAHAIARGEPVTGASLLAAVVCDLGEMFARDDPRFDQGKWHDACGRKAQ